MGLYGTDRRYFTFCKVPRYNIHLRVVVSSSLRAYVEDGHFDAALPLKERNARATKARWTRFADVKADVPSVDQAWDRLIFNTGGNKYRLVCVVDYGRHGLLVRFIGTHAEYDRIDVRAV